MNIEPKFGHHLRLRTEMASGKIEGMEYHITQNADNQAFFIEFEKMKGKETCIVMFAMPFRDMVLEAYEFAKKKGFPKWTAGGSEK